MECMQVLTCGFEISDWNGSIGFFHRRDKNKMMKIILQIKYSLSLVQVILFLF